MASVNQGGRPRNAWTPSRERKLVRLYTLTNLTKDEIQRILEAPGFNPSTSDIQKKLRALFPKDYAKDHKRYRPSNGSNMAIRLRRIRQCGGSRGRISKARKCSSKKKLLKEKSALRILSCLEAQADLSPICPESFPTAPELLMLDGSILQLRLEENINKNDLGWTFDMIASSQSEINLATKSHMSRKSNASSSILSIRSIARRLARPYSQGRLEHIRSVLRSSYSGSARSSLLSIGSLSSFYKSTNEQIAVDSQPANDRIMDHVCNQSLEHNPLNNMELEVDEQRVWDELIDETHVTKRAAIDFRSFVRIYSGPRPCCGTFSYNLVEPGFLCCSCGFSDTLYLAAKLEVMRPLSPDFYHQKDYYGNTCLHYAAAGLKDQDIDSIDQIMWILDGFIEAKNTFGQTFVHLLQLPRNYEDCPFVFNTWLRKLFSLPRIWYPRDYHGRISIHAFIHNSFHRLTPETFRLILDIFQPASKSGIFHLYDVFGETINDIVDTHNYHQKGTLVGKKYTAHQQLQGHQAPIISLDEIKRIDEWTGRVVSVSWGYRIDKDGNSPLIGLLKIWPIERDEWKLWDAVRNLILRTSAAWGGFMPRNLPWEVTTRIVVSVHAKDRNGDTPLIIAATRGFRMCVAHLLEIGANYHCRDFTGAGILLRVSKIMDKAKRENDIRLYSRVLSSFTLLVDAGAKPFPSDDDEWLYKYEFYQKRYFGDKAQSRIRKAEARNFDEMKALAHQLTTGVSGSSTK